MILGKTMRTVATRCQIKYTKIDFGWGSDPDPTQGAYIAIDKSSLIRIFQP